MKKYLILVCLSMSFLCKAQNEDLLEHSWQLEKVTIDNQTELEEGNFFGEFVFLGFDVYEGYVTLFFDNLVAEISLIDESDSFEITDAYYTLGEVHGTLAANMVKYEFFTSFEDGGINSPFEYSITVENELMYLNITNPNGDSATFFTSTLSNSTFDTIELNIYPNPTSNLLHIEASQTDISKVEIFDVQGKRVMQVSAPNLRELDVSQLTNGMYFLKVRTSDGELTRKFVKK